MSRWAGFFQPPQAHDGRPRPGYPRLHRAGDAGQHRARHASPRKRVMLRCASLATWRGSRKKPGRCGPSSGLSNSGRTFASACARWRKNPGFTVVAVIYTGARDRRQHSDLQYRGYSATSRISLQESLSACPNQIQESKRRRRLGFHGRFQRLADTEPDVRGARRVQEFDFRVLTG